MSIPRLIHQIWFGPDPVPDNIRSLCTQTEKMNNGWKYRLHGNELLARYHDDPYIHRMMEVGDKLAFVADRLRVLLLRDEGGVYIDADAQPISPLDSIPVWDMPHVDFVHGSRDTYRPGVALHRAIPIVDNTFLASAKNGRMANRLVSCYSSKTPRRNGHAVGCEIINHSDWTVVNLGFKYVYALERHPETLFLHDGINLASWCDTPRLQFAT